MRRGNRNLRGMAASEDLPPRVETLLDELAHADWDWAADLLRAVTAYTDAEVRLAAMDKAGGQSVSSERLDRIARLESIRLVLERELKRSNNAG
jgi:hypothetical protein